jgi:hypothetical protein
MEMPGWRWMLLVLLLVGQRLETSGIAVIDEICLVCVCQSGQANRFLAIVGASGNFQR